MNSLSLSVTPFQCRFFPIYVETLSVKENQETDNYIELCEFYAINYDEYLCPLQIYQTKNPLLYRLVAAISPLLWDDKKGFYVKITDHNIRNIDMTVDKKINYVICHNNDFIEEHIYFRQKIIDLSIHSHKIDSCSLKHIYLCDYNEYTPYTNIDKNLKDYYYSYSFLNKQYCFNLNYTTILDTISDEITFRAGFITYTHKHSQGQLRLYSQPQDIKNILSDLFSELLSIYPFGKLSSPVYSFIERFIGFDKDSIEILVYNLKEKTIIFTARQWIFQIENDNFSFYSIKEQNIFNKSYFQDQKTFMNHYLIDCYQLFLEKTWGFIYGKPEFYLQDIYNEKFMDSPLIFNIGEMTYLFDGISLKLKNHFHIVNNFLENASCSDEGLTLYIEKQFGFNHNFIHSIHQVNEKQLFFSVRDVSYQIKNDIFSIYKDSTYYPKNYYHIELACWKKYISGQLGFPIDQINILDVNLKKECIHFSYDQTLYEFRENHLNII